MLIGQIEFPRPTAMGRNLAYSYSPKVFSIQAPVLMANGMKLPDKSRPSRDPLWIWVGITPTQSSLAAGVGRGQS